MPIENLKAVPVKIQSEPASTNIPMIEQGKRVENGNLSVPEPGRSFGLFSEKCENGPVPRQSEDDGTIKFLWEL